MCTKYFSMALNVFYSNDNIPPINSAFSNQLSNAKRERK